MGAVLLRTSSLVLRVANAAPLGRFHTRSTLISHVLLLADCIDRACNREMARDWYRVRFFARFLWKTRYTLSPMLLRKERTYSSVITFSIERFFSTRCKLIGFPSFPRWMLLSLFELAISVCFFWRFFFCGELITRRVSVLWISSKLVEWARYSINDRSLSSFHSFAVIFSLVRSSSKLSKEQRWYSGLDPLNSWFFPCSRVRVDSFNDII